MKPYKVSRRFVVSQDETGTYLQFGNGSDEETTLDNVADPSSVVLELNGKNYITDTSFDPNKLLNTGKMGISPANTTLRIVYGKNSTSTVSVSVGQLTSIGNLSAEFPDESVLNTTIRQSVLTSVEVTNEEIIAADASTPTKDEIKLRSLGALASQNRAVTKNDYEAMAYMMPKKFGGVARASVVNDPSSSNRRLSLYVVSVDKDGNFTSSNNTMKNNLKTWLNKNKMLNDSIDIYDAKIVNISLTYKITVDPQKDKYGTISAVNAKLVSELTRNKMFIGEPLYISQIYSIINSVEGVIDTKSVKFENKNSGNYSATYVNMDELYSSDGMYLKTPKNAVLEIKYPTNDIKGIVY